MIFVFRFSKPIKLQRVRQMYERPQKEERLEENKISTAGKKRIKLKLVTFVFRFSEPIKGQRVKQTY